MYLLNVQHLVQLYYLLLLLLYGHWTSYTDSQILQIEIPTTYLIMFNKISFIFIDVSITYGLLFIKCKTRHIDRYCMKINTKENKEDRL